jgi:hypothetical protein
MVHSQKIWKPNNLKSLNYKYMNSKIHYLNNNIILKYKKKNIAPSVKWNICFKQWNWTRQTLIDNDFSGYNILRQSLKYMLFI